MAIIVLALFLLVPVKAVAEPSIVFDSESHDFGDVSQGDVLEHFFKFTNKGTEELIIIEVKST